ncbi:MAG TPA: YdeI/OmpD-associated family protein [Steroidobacteraceae bacterium]
MTKTFTVEIIRHGAICYIPVAFDPKAAFGKARAPVKVTLNGYTYRSTIATMGGITGIPLRRSNREAAGLNGGETIAVKIELDTESREVELPPDLENALRKKDATWNKWQTLSYTNRREAVESVNNAKKPETRVWRVAAIVQALTKR